MVRMTLWGCGGLGSHAWIGDIPHMSLVDMETNETLMPLLVNTY